MTKNKNNKRKGIICIVMAIIMILGATLAYFSDYANLGVNGNAGTMGINLDSHINLLDEDGQDILNPGDQRDASFIVSNTGNKSADIRTIITLESSVPMVTSGQAEYELYKKSDITNIDGVGNIPVIFGDDFGYKGETGVDAKLAYAMDYVVNSVDAEAIVGIATESNPLEVRNMSSDGKTITYNVPDVVLNGIDTGNGEFEVENGIVEDNHLYDYVLVVNTNTKNAFQNSTVSISVSVLAKQHRNTGYGWALVDNAEDIIHPETPETNTYSIETASSASFLSLKTANTNGENITEAKAGETVDVSYELTNKVDYLNGEDASFGLGETEVTSYSIYNKDTNELIDTIDINSETQSIASALFIQAHAASTDGKASFTMPEANVLIVENIEQNSEVIQNKENSKIYDLVLDTGYDGWRWATTTIDADKNFTALGSRRIIKDTNSFSYGTELEYDYTYGNTVLTTNDTGLRGTIPAGTQVTISFVPLSSTNAAGKDLQNYGLSYYVVDYDTGALIERVDTGTTGVGTFTMPEQNIKVMSDYNNHIVNSNGTDYIAMNIFHSIRKITGVGTVTITSDKPMKDYGISKTFNINETLPEIIWVQPNSNISFKYNRTLNNFDEWMSYNDPTYNHDTFFSEISGETLLNLLKDTYTSAYTYKKNSGETDEQIAQWSADFTGKYLVSSIKETLSFGEEYSLIDKYYSTYSTDYFNNTVSIDSFEGYHFSNLFNVSTVSSTADHLEFTFTSPGLPFELSCANYMTSGFDYKSLITDNELNTLKDFINTYVDTSSSSGSGSGSGSTSGGSVDESGSNTDWDSGW